MRKSHLIVPVVSMLVAILIPASCVEAAGSLSIQSLSPGASVAVGAPLTLTVNTSGFTNPNFLIEDNFGGGSLRSTNINSSGDLSWTPTIYDIGTHSITISASDSLGNNANIVQMVTVNTPTIVLSSPSPSATVVAGTLVSFSASVLGYYGTTYALSDAFGGTISNNNINSSGYFAWVPNTITDIGNHVITVKATDSLGHTTSADQHITVTAAGSVTITSLLPSYILTPGDQLTFTVTTTGVSSPSYMVRDSFIPATINNLNINSSGGFSWIPNENQIGTHNITVTVSDTTNGKSLSVSRPVYVERLALNVTGLSQSTIYPGNSTYFSLTTGGLSSTTYSVSDNFQGSTVSATNLNALGNFYWVPGASDVGTHILKLIATDTLGHTASTTQQIIVRSPATSTPTITPPVVSYNPTLVTPPVQTNTPPITPPPHVFTTYLAPGSNGAEVVLLQIALAKEGFFTLTPNGNYGPATTAAVKKFQTAHGLEAVGFIGPGTRSVLNGPGGVAPTTNPTPQASTAHTYKFTTNLAVGSVGKAVSELQKRLTEAGIYTGPISGTFGPMTKAAVMKFQAKHGIAQLGGVGPGTRAALNAE